MIEIFATDNYTLLVLQNIIHDEGGVIG